MAREGNVAQRSSIGVHRAKLRVLLQAGALFLCCMACIPTLCWGIARVWAIKCEGDTGATGYGLHETVNACGLTAMVVVLVIGVLMLAGVFVCRVIAVWSLERWRELDSVETRHGVKVPAGDGRPTLRRVK